MTLSRKLIAAVRGSGRPQYLLARAAGLHPVALSDLMRGARDCKSGEPRIVRLGGLVGVAPEECFEPMPRVDDVADRFCCG